MSFELLFTAKYKFRSWIPKDMMWKQVKTALENILKNNCNEAIVELRDNYGLYGFAKLHRNEEGEVLLDLYYLAARYRFKEKTAR